MKMLGAYDYEGEIRRMKLNVLAGSGAYMMAIYETIQS